MAKDTTEPSARVLLSAIHQLAHEKNIEEEVILEMLKDAMANAAAKFYRNEGEFEVDINEETGTIDIAAVKTVVEEVEDSLIEISLEDAVKLDDSVSVGDRMRFPKNKSEMGRIAANAAKQVIVQKVREFERFNIYKEFEDRINEVVNVTVRRFERGSIIVDMGKTEGVIRRENMLPRERYNAGDRIRAVIVDIQKTGDVQVELSRTDPKLLIKLFEMEVPEVYDGTVMIRNIVREPGDRSKIAVFSNENDVDPIGACVGVGGSRIKAVLKELRGEKIDVIKFEDDIEHFAMNAMSPAKVLRMSIADRDEKRLEAIVSEEQYSLAIGTHGQNVRLASKLVGWTIDVKKEADKKNEIMAQMGGHEDDLAGPVRDAADGTPVSDMPGIGVKTEAKLAASGYTSVETIVSATVEELSDVSGFGQKSAERLLIKAKKFLEGGAK